MVSPPTAAAPSASHADRPLRIAFASYRSHPHVGGQGVYVRHVSAALAALGHEVTVISGPPYPDLVEGVWLERLPSLDLFARKNAFLAFRARFLVDRPDLTEWALHNTGAFGEMCAFGLRLEHSLKARPGRFDILHDNQGLSASLLRIAKRGLPVAATLHHPITADLELALEAQPVRWRRWALRRWHSFLETQKRVARTLPALLTVSEAAKARAVADFALDPARIRVALNGVDHDVFHPRPDVERTPNLIVTAASADVPLKGLAVLLRALAQLRQHNNNARLIVIGRLRDGPARAVLEEAGLAEHVEFVTNLSTNDIAGLYAQAAIVACPSLYEGFGLPAAEAMACGAPVVASDGGGLPEVVGDAGRLVPAGDAGALAKALGDLLNDAQERARLSAAGAARARACFSWTAHAEAAVAMYRELLHPAPTASNTNASTASALASSPIATAPNAEERLRAHNPA